MDEKVCGNVDDFLSSVNNYLIDNNHIENMDENPLANLEYSEAKMIVSSKGIDYTSYKVDPHTNKLEKIITSSKSREISTRIR
ncbi:hypothetical protein [Dryocola clanedunensis]|uniref:hypothetical protein n=1 Tax=Cedecea sulfonylureivorans TaxID=3051154 RepID=UPI001F287545|nr:hypothetical protein [Cedecea sulfonylureivorans]